MHGQLYDIQQEVDKYYNQINKIYLDNKKIKNDGILAPNDKISALALMERPIQSYMNDEEFIQMGANISKNYQTTNKLIYDTESSLEIQILYSNAAKTMSRSKYIDYMKFTAENNINNESNELLVRNIFSTVSTHQNLWADSSDERLIDIANTLLVNLSPENRSINFYKAVVAGKVNYHNRFGEQTDSLGNEAGAVLPTQHVDSTIEQHGKSTPKKSYNYFFISLVIILVLLMASALLKIRKYHRSDRLIATSKNNKSARRF